MSGKYFCVFLFLFFSPLLASQDEQAAPYQMQMFSLPEGAIAESKEYRKQWTRLTGFEYSGLHWNQFMVIFTNGAGDVYQHNHNQFAAWFDDPDDEDNLPEYQPYPEGTVILKENFSVKEGKPDKPLTITAMIKHAPGFDPAGGDWEYVQFNQDGRLILRGSAKNNLVNKTCASCHNSVSERDHVFASVYTHFRKTE